MDTHISYHGEDISQKNRWILFVGISGLSVGPIGFVLSLPLGPLWTIVSYTVFTLLGIFWTIWRYGRKKEKEISEASFWQCHLDNMIRFVNFHLLSTTDSESILIPLLFRVDLCNKKYGLDDIFCSKLYELLSQPQVIETLESLLKLQNKPSPTLYEKTVLCLVVDICTLICQDWAATMPNIYLDSDGQIDLKHGTLDINQNNSILETNDIIGAVTKNTWHLRALMKEIKTLRNKSKMKRWINKTDEIRRLIAGTKHRQPNLRNFELQPNNISMTRWYTSPNLSHKTADLPIMTNMPKRSITVSPISEMLLKSNNIITDNGQFKSSNNSISSTIKNSNEKLPETQEPELFRSLDDLIAFDPDLKHQTPIRSYEFKFLLDAENMCKNFAKNHTDKKQLPPHWDLAVDHSHTKFWKNSDPNSPYIIVMGFAALAAIPPDVVDLHIRHTPLRLKWDTIFADYAITNGPENNQIIYSALKSPVPFVTPRDFVQWRRILEIEEHEDDSTNMPCRIVQILHRSAASNTFPPRPGYVRAETLINGYIIKSLPIHIAQGLGMPALPPESNHTLLFILASTDIKGSIPKWVVNQTAAKAPAMWVNNLKTACIAHLKDNTAIP